MRTMRITTTERQSVSALYKAASLELKSENAKAKVTNYSAGAQLSAVGLGGG